MAKKILIINGHPDPDPSRFCHSLAEVYEVAAENAGHTIQTVHIATLEFPLLRSRKEWEAAPSANAIADSQKLIAEAQHIVIIYPLWLGSMPAALKGFFEQAFRPGFAIDSKKRTLRPGLLHGKSVRIIVTMGMPSFIYRWYFMAHGLKSLERNILRFAGLGPIQHSIVGNVEGSPRVRDRWVERIRKLGAGGF